MTPAAMTSFIQSLSLKGVLTSVREYEYLVNTPELMTFCVASGTINDLAHNA